MDWFLYDNGLHHERVKSKNSSAANYLLFRGKPLTIITKRFILDVAAALDPPLIPYALGKWLVKLQRQNELL